MEGPGNGDEEMERERAGLVLEWEWRVNAGRCIGHTREDAREGGILTLDAGSRWEGGSRRGERCWGPHSGNI